MFVNSIKIFLAGNFVLGAQAHVYQVSNYYDKPITVRLEHKDGVGNVKSSYKECDIMPGFSIKVTWANPLCSVGFKYKESTAGWCKSAKGEYVSSNWVIKDSKIEQDDRQLEMWEETSAHHTDFYISNFLQKPISIQIRQQHTKAKKQGGGKKTETVFWKATDIGQNETKKIRFQRPETGYAATHGWYDIAYKIKGEKNWQHRRKAGDRRRFVLFQETYDSKGEITEVRQDGQTYRSGKRESIESFDYIKMLKKNA